MKQLSRPNNSFLSELNQLQNRLDELRVMFRREIANDTLPDGPFQALICRTEKETVSIVVQNVEEVVPICQLTNVPDAAPWFLGLLNLGGEMIPVVDLEAKISGVRHDLALSDLIVVCTSPNGRVGLVVDEVVGIHFLNKNAVQTISGSLAGAPYLLGATEIDAKTVLLLNIQGLSSSATLSPEAFL